MMRMRKFQNLVMVGLLAVCLATCAPDPRNQADADATRLLAEQDAADQQQAREQAARVFSVELAEREQVSAQWVRSRQEFIRWSMLAATMALSLALRLAAKASSDMAKTPLSSVKKTISKNSMELARK